VSSLSINASSYQNSYSLNLAERLMQLQPGLGAPEGSQQQPASLRLVAQAQPGKKIKVEYNDRQNEPRFPNEGKKFTRKEILANDKLDLRGANLSFIDLSGVDLSKRDLTAVNLNGANLSNANLFKANLTNASLARANLADATMSYTNLSNADLVRATLFGTILANANMKGADLAGARIDRCSFYQADLRSVRFFDLAVVTDSDFERANLSGLKLPNLGISYFPKMQGAILTNADLSFVNLRGADLKEADLRGANLRRADLKGADLRGANLTGADRTGAEVAGSKGLNNEWKWPW
jgi:uncharacterized protein YjbI with pentapeptide repeats